VLISACELLAQYFDRPEVALYKESVVGFDRFILQGIRNSRKERVNDCREGAVMLLAPVLDHHKITHAIIAGAKGNHVMNARHKFS